MASSKEPLSVTHPELAAQADGWDPTTLTAHSNKKVGWKCDLGHTWKTKLSHRSNGSGCPVCSGRVAWKGLNDLATINPELAAQADGWDPTTLSAGSGKKVKWKCEKGHKWESTIANRSSGTGCPTCSNKKTLTGYNDLATINPELAAQADGWDPTTLTAYSGKRMGWKCDLGHTWTVPVSDRSYGSGCPVCSGRVAWKGLNDLATINPELAAQADGWDPTTLTAYSNKKVGWKCDLGHTWTSNINNRSNGKACPVCSNNKVLSGFNDIATTNSELAAQADGWDPTTLQAHSNKKVGWKCEKGHTWTATVGSRTNGNGCPSCSVFGFNPSLRGWLYLIDHDELQMFQIGISNFPESRIGQHSKRGWEVIEVRGPMEGLLAQQIETAILHAVERRGAVLGHKADIDKFDGYSEAWTKDSLTVTSFKQLLDWVYQDDENMMSADGI